MKVFMVLLVASLLAVFFKFYLYGLVGLLLLTLWQPLPTIVLVGVVIGVLWQFRGQWL